MLRIAITGPESSGKTTLAKALAAHYGVPWVPEFAREYLEGLGRPYVEEDLVRIAEGQREAEERSAEQKPSILICDTDLLVIRIWAREKFGRVDPRLEEMTSALPYQHALLCRPDIPWAPDPLRENPDDRERLFAVYQTELEASKRPYVIVHGNRQERLHHAVATIDHRIF